MKILYLHCHDMGRYNSVYGHKLNTPNLERFSRDATVFGKAFCTYPTCSPSRGSLLTGMYPSTNGLTGLVHMGYALNDPSRHLAHFLREQGCITALCGIQHEAGDPRTLGYDQIYPDIDYEKNPTDFPARDAFAAASAIRFIEQHKGDSFFLSCGFFYPHRPFLKRKHVNPDSIKVPDCLPDIPEIRKDYADYAESVSYMDTLAGLVLDALKENGIFEDTTIILTTDHGIPFPYMKCNLYDTGIGVTLLMKLARTKTVPFTDALVSHVDVFPTLCEFYNLPAPDSLQGLSLLPLLNGEKDSVRDTVFAQTDFHVASEPVRLVRTKRHAYIRRFSKNLHFVLDNVDSGPTKTKMSKYLADQEHEAEELYDLLTDPGQRCNLAGDPQYSDLIQSLREVMRNQMVQTGDLEYFDQV